MIRRSDLKKVISEPVIFLHHGDSIIISKVLKLESWGKPWRVISLVSLSPLYKKTERLWFSVQTANKWQNQNWVQVPQPQYTMAAHSRNGGSSVQFIPIDVRSSGLEGQSGFGYRQDSYERIWGRRNKWWKFYKILDFIGQSEDEYVWNISYCWCSWWLSCNYPYS